MNTDSARYRNRAWAWLKGELVRRLGADVVRELWAEYARLTRLDRVEGDVVRARNVVAHHERSAAWYRREGDEESAARHEERRQAALARLERAQAKATRIREEISQ